MDIKKKIFDAQSPVDLPHLEEEVIKFWDAEEVFNKSLEQRKGEDKFTFYDGPPFANGMPHYGHMLAMGIKDLFVRFKTMQGYYVPRRNGWDCHGLPVEYQLEKELGISGKKEIEEYGIDKFNQKARESVFRYVDEWTHTIKRMGRWVDFSNTYTTLDKNYIESVWWVFKKIWDKDLVYKDYTSQPYCTRCGTSLSNFETNQGYKDNIKDPSVYVKFQLVDAPNEFLLAWTTTPWTLPANLALAVDKKVQYGKYKTDDCYLWIAKELAKNLLGEEVKAEKLVHGSELISLKYKPLFPVSNSSLNHLDGMENAYKVYGADFVTLDDGTGIVHIAPAYGEDDMKLGKASKLPVVFSAGYDGRMISEIGKGLYIKEADPVIEEDLKKRSLLWRSGQIKHTYPFCWRCDTPLIYIAISTWFVAVSKIKDQLVDLNRKTKWQPSYLRDGRFGKWLEGARDWNIARQRYWGAPIPLWQCEKCNETKVISSIAELNKGSDFDPHRPQIDDVEFSCSCGGTMKRIPDVFDCWFESGSMPYAQWHYPFANKEEFNEDFPADFIAEGLDQTRGWFYTMHVIAGVIFEEPAFYNVVVNGLVLAEDGQKLSKKLRNYPEPSEIFDDLGADALRQYLFSATQIGEDYRFSKKLVAEEARKTVFPLWNSLVFYLKFMQKGNGRADEEGQLLDAWMQAKINEATVEMTNYLEDYDLTRAARKIKDLAGDISLWYLRLSRKRTDAAFAENLRKTLRKTAVLIAPFMPFLGEIMYQALRNESDPISVHLENWPRVSNEYNEVINEMADVRSLVELGHAARAYAKLKVRQPLESLHYEIGTGMRLDPSLESILLRELNINSVSNTAKENWQTQESGRYKISINTELSEGLKCDGDAREIMRAIQSLRKQAGLMPGDVANVIVDHNQLDEKVVEEIGESTNSKVSIEKKPDASKKEARVELWSGTANIYLV